LRDVVKTRTKSFKRYNLYNVICIFIYIYIYKYMYNVFNCITKSTIAVFLETLKKYSIHFFIPMRDDHLSMSSMRLFPGIRFMHFYSQLKYVSPRDNVFCSPIIQTQLSRQICFVLVNDFKMFMFVSTTLYEWYYNLVLLLDLF
jgi:hypothetical protein